MPPSPEKRRSFVTGLLLVTVAVAGCRTTAPAGGDAGPAVPAAGDLVGQPTSAPAGQPTTERPPMPDVKPGIGVPGQAGQSPAERYAACRERVEQPESEGECSTDGDCAAVGCSGELCVAKAVAGDIMSTCEVQPCFQVLDTCGCVEGRCSWSLKETPPDEPAPDAPPEPDAAQ